MPDWLEVLITALTGTGGTAGIFLIFRKLVISLRALAFGRGIERIHDVYAVLNSILSETGANRVMVLRAKNDGGIPRPGHKLTTSLQYEVWVNPLQGIKKDWQNRDCDEQYVSLLDQLFREKTKRILVRKMRKESELKTLYTAQGIVRAELFSLGIQDGEQFCYLSIVYTERPDDPDFPERDLDAHDKAVIDTAVSKLKKLLAAVGG